MDTARIMMKQSRLVCLPYFPRLFTFCTAVLAVASLNSAQAQDWRFEPIIRVGSGYDDNATLHFRTDQEVELTGALLDLRADIKYSSETTSFVLQPRFLSRNYSDNSEFDSDDYFLRSTFSYEGRSSMFGFRVNFDDQTIRTAERAISDLEIEDPDEITDDDTGRVLLVGNRSKWRTSPYWKYQLSNASSIGADFDYISVDYDNVFEGLLADYSDARLNLNYRRAFSNVNAGLLTVTGREYDHVVADDDISGYGVLIGFEHALSVKTKVTAMFGVEETQHSVIEFDPEVVGHITLARDLETIRMFARYRRSISASGASRLAIRDAVNLNFRRRLSDKISAGLGVRAYRSSRIDPSATNLDRNYVQLQSRFLWYLSSSFVIEANYRYTVSDRRSTDGERSNSNQINLWFTYQPRTTPRI